MSDATKLAVVVGYGPGVGAAVAARLVPYRSPRCRSCADVPTDLPDQFT